MKKGLTILILICLISLFIRMSFLPERLDIHNKRVIDIPVDQLFQQFNEIRKFNSWFYWEEMPPDGIQIHYYEPSKGLGSGYEWGHQEKGEHFGKYKITEVIPNKQIRGRLTVSGKSADIIWSFSTTKDHKTLLDWSYRSAEIPFYLRLFSWLQKDEIKHSFTTALDRLEKNLFKKEDESNNRPKYTISEKEILPMPYTKLLTIFQETSADLEEVRTAFLESSSKAFSYLKDYKGYDDTVIGSPAIFFMSWDTRLDKATFYAGVTIHKRVPTEEDMEIKVFGGGEVLKANLRQYFINCVS